MGKVAVWVSLLAFSLIGCEEEGAGSSERKDEIPAVAGERESAELAGSHSCRECHERFYALWASSHHGTAMQPFSQAVARQLATDLGDPLEIAGREYRFLLEGDQGYVVETSGDAKTKLPVAHVMGGKNVFFFLTPMERGRLQVLPIAYDVRRKSWYDTTASMLRHAEGHPDEAVAWTDPLLTFNTSCWSCHVSQLSVNYDEATDTYSSSWAEPGINCETCHGSAVEHVRRYREATGGESPATPAIRSIKALTPAQRNDACGTCHAKAVALTPTFQPGDRFFDHFDLTCLEDRDFYPDGRDLGENYTMTSWRMNPCAQQGKLDCIHCHTSSGRYRFATERPNGACLPCHADRVSDVASHAHHPADSAGSRCVACHMPMTEFARMRRSDHSMRPPAPSLTLAHKSPNACNICHEDRDAEWADDQVRAWHARDYQAPMLEQAGLVAAAREGDWTKLDAMLAAVVSEGRDEIIATSLIRLLVPCADERVGSALLTALADPSPLVRSAAAAGLREHPSRETFLALWKALDDDVRLVRVRAAGALPGIPQGDLPEDERARYDRAMEELEAALGGRPDSWSSHYNVGNLREQQGDLPGALAAYRKAASLRDDVIQPHVNAAMVLARLGKSEEAEAALRTALGIDGENAAVHYNLGLLMAERERMDAARGHLEAAFDFDPSLAAAAYNLAVLLAADDLEAAIAWSRKAHLARKDDPRYAHTHAYYLREHGHLDDAVAILEGSLQSGVVSLEIFQLLGETYGAQGHTARARELYTRASVDPRLPRNARRIFRQRASQH